MTEHDEPDLQPGEVRLLARQIDGWACIRCGEAPGIDKPMKPAGVVDGRQVFWCATNCLLNPLKPRMTVGQVRRADEVLQKVINKHFQGPLNQADALALFNLHITLREGLQ
ncbi:hypothetical protein [Nonomuraea sp. NPDC005650]|uniref:hypothetical protein n=1 Tax=Nonomuraea sp. NPDC005650 TaxID=3157045 RepID=UPI0033B58D48